MKRFCGVSDDVHVLGAEGAAIGLLQRGDQVAQAHAVAPPRARP